MSLWEDIVKNDIIDLVSLLDRYLTSIDYNPNISKVRGELLNAFDLEEIEVIVGNTKVNIIEHKVEGYSRNPSVPNGIITDLKEKGYKYRGIVLKRAKVIENRV
jgi:molecular chaperone GrpE (heat shock protein)